MTGGNLFTIPKERAFAHRRPYRTRRSVAPAEKTELCCWSFQLDVLVAGKAEASEEGDAPAFGGDKTAVFGIAQNGSDHGESERPLRHLGRPTAVKWSNSGSGSLTQHPPGIGEK
jgi:hypothetical protein